MRKHEVSVRVCNIALFMLSHDLIFSPNVLFLCKSVCNSPTFVSHVHLTLPCSSPFSFCSQQRWRVAVKIEHWSGTSPGVPATTRHCQVDYWVGIACIMSLVTTCLTACTICYTVTVLTSLICN